MSLQNSLTNYSFLTLLISLVLVWASSVQTLLINDNSSKSKPLKKNKFLKKSNFLNNSSSCSQPQEVTTLTPPTLNPEGVRVGGTRAPKGFTNQSEPLRGFCPQSLPLRDSPTNSTSWGQKELEGSDWLSKDLGGVRGSNAVILNESVLLSFLGIAASYLKLGETNSISSKFNVEGLFEESKKGLFFFKNKVFELSIVLISNFLCTCILILRWTESGHFPLSNLYESLMFLSWCFTAFYLNYEMSFFVQSNSYPNPEGVTTSFDNISKDMLVNSERVQDSTKQRDSGRVPVKKEKKYKNVQKLVGFVAIPCALLCNAFARFTLPKEMQEASPLVPALQSNWLMMHVSVIVLSYALLILGSLMSILFLIVNQVNLNKFESSSLNIEFELDNLSYRILALGFPLLTIGILSGAVWANEAWGSYWSWDPKETWALLTWLVFAVYLHTRLSKGWQGKKPAVIASFGFFIVWMCYLGVNLIGEGLHSYGWIVKV